MRVRSTELAKRPSAIAFSRITREASALQRTGRLQEVVFMRFYALAATLLLVAGLSACSKSGSDQSSSTATTAPDAAATAAADTSGAAATDAPKDGG